MYPSTTGPSYFAAGNIAPRRFVYISAAYRVSQAAANSPACGVSQPGTRFAPGTPMDDGYAAVAGEGITVFGPGNTALLDLGGTVAAGDLLVSDANGKGVTLNPAAVTDQFVGAQAQQAGVAGDAIRVQVVQFSGRPA